MSNNNQNKKGWRPGRNPLTLILVVLIVFIVFLAIYIPSSIVKSYNEGKVEYFQDADKVATINEVYNSDDITYYDSPNEFKDWTVKLEAYEYRDVLDDMFNADEYNKRVETTNTDSMTGEEITTVTYENEYSGDVINFSITLGLPEGKSDLSDYQTLSSSYVVYGCISTASNWIADHSCSSAIQFTANNITSNKTLTSKKITCKTSYPAKKTTVWPFTTTVDSPDVYLFLYHRDSKGASHQSVIRYTYKDYMTKDTIGSIVSPH